MSKTRVNCHRAVLRCLLLFALTLVILITGRAVYADPGMPLRRMPICGDQDGSENPLTFNCADFGHVPNVQTYQVPGTGSFDFQADFIYREATYNNELGFYIVDNNAGAVGELEPGEPGYLEAAFNRARIIFPSGSNAYVQDYSTELQGGQILVFFIVQNNNLTSLRANNPNNNLGRTPIAFFSIDSLNPDGRDHFVGFARTTGGLVQFGFEDLTNGGDNDYDDVAYNINSPIAPLPEAGLLSLPFEHKEDDRGLAHVWSFFDHEYPIAEREPASRRATIRTFTGQTLTGTVTACTAGSSCYSGHSGIDFTYGLPEGSAVLAAAGGTVRSGTEKCGGNYVYIDHGEYQTAYLHLLDDKYWKKEGEPKAGDRIGSVGSTGDCTTGAHLHFAVYYDQNGDGRFAWPDELVDPFGWRDQCATADTDPWTQPFRDAFQAQHTGATSKWLWNFSQPACVTVEANAAFLFQTPDGVLVDIPQGAITTRATLAITAAPEPGQGLGYAGFLTPGASERSVLSTVSVGTALQISGLGSNGNPLTSFAGPIAVTIPYGEDDLIYADETSLSVYQSDAATGTWSVIPAQVDVNANKVTVLLQEPGILSVRGRPLQAAPSVSSISPAGGNNAIPTSITIHGGHFLDTPAVNLGESSLAIQQVSPTTIVAVVPARMTAGTYALTVRNPDGQIAIVQDAFEVRGFLYIPGVLR